MTLRVALVGGPMYDGLYEQILKDVEVVVHADHPTLNREVATRLGAGERLDVISTHSKYAPSQAAWLRPLDELISPAVVAAMAPAAVELCRFREALLSVPRNIDVRVLWWRTDLLAEAPATWSELLASGAAFGFTGRESGLFGLFFELVAGAGGRLFDDDLRPMLRTDECVHAVATIVELARRAPADLPGWHYDDVDAALADGRVAIAAAWPGGYGSVRGSPHYSDLAPAPYPAGPERRVSYSGCHAWAIPQTCGDVDAAVSRVQQLCSADAAARDAAGGTVPARQDIARAVRPMDEIDALRLDVTRDTIANAMITYPPLVRFPEIEDAGWGAIHEALLGRATPDRVVGRLQEIAEEVLRDATL